MNGPHFTEIVEIVVKTTGCTKTAMIDKLGVSTFIFWYWRKNGVPVAIKPYVMSVLSAMLRDYEIRSAGA